MPVPPRGSGHIWQVVGGVTGTVGVAVAVIFGLLQAKADSSDGKTAAKESAVASSAPETEPSGSPAAEPEPTAPREQEPARQPGEFDTQELTDNGWDTEPVELAVTEGPVNLDYGFTDDELNDLNPIRTDEYDATSAYFELQNDAVIAGGINTDRVFKADRCTQNAEGDPQNRWVPEIDQIFCIRTSAGTHFLIQRKPLSNGIRFRMWREAG
ncbi:hypothetical protein SRB5_59680 [Streptomyces sp. RB5]|uniref:Uncharacterized protein n=1 Tax=Streptomyces smaragdinus TaxID=2585196 RepID=A0A7K0CQL9_9ACTN|nr:hypothetical protein [Streptomyces smaragdinus]MQY15777.1 hypothetical protein [Streptomyces smaragdinus]